jgi:hypothetical protein
MISIGTKWEMALMKESLTSSAIAVLNKQESACGTEETCPYNGGDFGVAGR